MIIESLINIFGNIAIFLLNLLPTFPDFGSMINSTLDPFFEVLNSIDVFISLPTLGFCILALFLFTNIEFIFSVIMWIIRKIPGVS